VHIIGYSHGYLTSTSEDTILWLGCWVGGWVGGGGWVVRRKLLQEGEKQGYVNVNVNELRLGFSNTMYA
jgi:hypothetical protein